MKPVRSVHFLLALVASAVALGVPAALGDELPADTSAIENLTPEQARRLAAEFPGASAEITIMGSSKATFFKALPLNGLKALDADTARALAGYGKETLILNGLTTIDADAARALAGFKGPRLVLNGLTRLDAATAKQLATFQGEWLGLSGLSSLDAETATALAESKSVRLDLSGLPTLDATIAKPLAGFRGQMLVLNGLTTLDAATAKSLAEFQGNLLQHNDLQFSLPTLEFDAAEALAEYRGLIGLGEDVIEKLVADHPLSPQTALVYASLSNGVLPFLTAFDSPDSVEIAKALATRKGRLALPNLEKISPKTLTALIAKEDVEIPPIETLELIAEPDGSGNDDFVIPERFKAR